MRLLITTILLLLLTTDAVARRKPRLRGRVITRTVIVRIACPELPPCQPLACPDQITVLTYGQVADADTAKAMTRNGIIADPDFEREFAAWLAVQPPMKGATVSAVREAMFYAWLRRASAGQVKYPEVKPE